MNDRILRKYVPATPQGWTSRTIGDALEVIDEPIRMSDDETYDLVSIRRRHGGLFHRESLPGRDILTKTLRRVIPGSFMIARMQIVHGAAAYVAEEFAGSCVSKSYSQFKGRPGCNTKYFSFLAQHPLMADYFMDSSQGVVIEKMTFDQNRWLGYRVVLPPLNEQRWIVDAIDAMDRQVLATGSVLAKLRQTRKGMLEELVGRRVVNSCVDEAIAGSPSNGIYKPSSLIGSGALLIGQTAITQDRLVDPRLGRRAAVSRAELGRFGLRAGDLLVSRVFATVDGVGQPALITSLDEPAVFESNMMRLRCDTSKADSRFLFLSLQTDRTRRHIARQVNLSNQASISQGALRAVPLWLPGLQTQERIAAAISAIEEMCDIEERKLTKLRNERAGLLSDLLTGRIRAPLGVL
jgi:type I restriction enzyme S subunit